MANTQARYFSLEDAIARDRASIEEIQQIEQPPQPEEGGHVEQPWELLITIAVGLFVIVMAAFL